MGAPAPSALPLPHGLCAPAPAVPISAQNPTAEPVPQARVLLCSGLLGRGHGPVVLRSPWGPNVLALHHTSCGALAFTRAPGRTEITATTRLLHRTAVRGS